MNDEQKEAFFNVYANQAASDEDCLAIANMLEECGASEAIEEEIETYLSQALSVLETLPDNQYRSNLVAWTEYIANRDK